MYRGGRHTLEVEEAEAAPTLTEWMRVSASQAEEVYLSCVHPASRAFDCFAFPVGDRTNLGGGGVVPIRVEGVDPASVAVGACSAAAE